MINRKELFILVLVIDPDLVKKIKEGFVPVKTKRTYFEVATPEEGLEIYENNPINVCLIDVDIPGAKQLMIKIGKDNPEVELMVLGSMSEEELQQELDEEIALEAAEKNIPLA